MFTDKDNRVVDNNKKMKWFMCLKVMEWLIKLMNTHKMKHYAALKNYHSIQ